MPPEEDEPVKPDGDEIQKMADRRRIRRIIIKSVVSIGLVVVAIWVIAHFSNKDAGDTVQMTLQSLTVTEHHKSRPYTWIGSAGTYYKHKATVTATFVKEGEGMDPVQYRKRETITKGVVGFEGSPQPGNTEFIDAAFKKKIKGGIVENGTYSVTLKKNGSFEKANRFLPGPSAVV